MKDKLYAVGKAMAALCACMILFSLIFAALYYFHWISQSMFHILNWIFSILSFLAAGVLLGIGIKKKALLHAFVLIAVMALIGFLLMDQYTLINIIEFLSKLIAYASGCLFITVKRND